ncbi:MAG: hypothetical protein ABIB71_02905 [Candidatus Woesearchaeota archaeon]
MKKPGIFIVIALLLCSTIVAAGFWEDLTGAFRFPWSAKKPIPPVEIVLVEPPLPSMEIPIKPIGLLYAYGSLSPVRDKIIEINGFEALEEILDIYNPYEPISQKENKFDAVFERYGYLDEEGRIFLIHVAHSLWLESSDIVPWSLKDYSRDEIAILLLWRYEESYHSMSSLIDNAQFSSEDSSWRLGNASKDWYKAFPLAKGLAEGSESQLQAAGKIIEWAEKNFLHAESGWGWEDTYGYPRNIMRYTLEELFQERIVGCQTTSMVVPAVLQSINIPAYKIWRDQHGVAYMPSLDLYVHGDFIADYAAIPASDLLMTKDELLGWSSSERGYLAFNDDIYNNRRQYNIGLHREGNSLFVSGSMLCSRYEDYWDQINSQLWEYNPSCDGDRVVSESVRIKNLDELTHQDNMGAHVMPQDKEIRDGSLAGVKPETKATFISILLRILSR